jgi:hypothetical protein
MDGDDPTVGGTLTEHEKPPFRIENGLSQPNRPTLPTITKPAAEHQAGLTDI